MIIGAAGKAAHLPGVLASYTALPVIGLPIKSSLLTGWTPFFNSADARWSTGCHGWGERIGQCRAACHQDNGAEVPDPSVLQDRADGQAVNEKDRELQQKLKGVLIYN